MELSSQEGEIPIPINSSYGHGHMIHHEPAPHHNHIIIPASSAPQIPSNGTPIGPIIPTTSLEDHAPYKKRVIFYRECLKNHAASMGGNATDGCGEFMPSGEEGTLEALTCSACNCHRNFHRKEVEGEPYSSTWECFHTSTTTPHLNRVGLGRKVINLGHHKNILGPEALGYPTGTLIPNRSVPPPPPPHHHQMIMPYNMGMGSLPSGSDEHDGSGGGDGGGGGYVTRPPHELLKKRFRTKFSQEQKEKMMDLAEKVGWKIQKQEEGVVQQFCQEIGVKRRVLKVWMHNNKHNLAKKNPSMAMDTPQINPI